MTTENEANYTYYDSRKDPDRIVPDKGEILRKQLAMWLEPGAQLVRNPLGLVGLVVVLAFALMAVSHPFLMKRVWNSNIYDPQTGYDFEVEFHPSLPSRTHLLGTDPLGRDVLSMFLYAARTSFGVGIVAGITAALIALVIGTLAAYYGGWVDNTLMMLAGAFVLMPPALMMLLVGLVIELSWFSMGLLFGIFAGLGSMAITFKAQALTIRVKPYVDASKIAGGKGLHIILKHLLPGMLSLIMVTTMFVVSQAMMVEALLSFFQGTQMRLSWGTMIMFIQTNWGLLALSELWYAILPPALAITLLAGAFYMLGRAMDESINPRLRER